MHFVSQHFKNNWHSTPVPELNIDYHACAFQIWVVVVLRSPIHANEPSEYNGMLYRTSNRVLNNGIKVIILICMDGTSQYHHHPNLAETGVNFQVCLDLQTFLSVI